MITKIFAFFVLISISVLAIAANPNVVYLIQSSQSTGNSTGVNFYPGNAFRTHQVTLEGASAVSAVGSIQGSNDGNQWITIATFSVTSASPSAASMVNETYAIERVNVTGIASSAASGTGLSVSVGY